MRVAVLVLTGRQAPIVGFLGEVLDEPGHEAVDLGTDTDAERVDYPDKAREINAVATTQPTAGLARLRLGVGASIAACKLPVFAPPSATTSIAPGVEHDDL